MQHLPLNDGQVEKSSLHGRCHFGTSVGRTGTLESRSFVAVVVSYVTSPPERAPGDNFLFLPWKRGEIFGSLGSDKF